MRQCVFSNGGKSRATRTFFALHASRKSFTGRPMLTNMKLACASVGFMPRSANHFAVKSRTAVFRARSAEMNDGSCWMAAIAARIASTLSDVEPEPASKSAIFLIVSLWPMAYPMRSPAMPYAFENVRATSTRGFSIAIGTCVS